MLVRELVERYQLDRLIPCSPVICYIGGGWQDAICVNEVEFDEKTMVLTWIIDRKWIERNKVQ